VFLEEKRVLARRVLTLNEISPNLKEAVGGLLYCQSLHWVILCCQGITPYKSPGFSCLHSYRKLFVHDDNRWMYSEPQVKKG
jgi:hypothetical protein